MREHFCDRGPRGSGGGSAGCPGHAGGRAAWCHVRALKQLEGDHQALHELARTFQELAPARLASLEAAAASWDAVRLRHVAHDLRGMLGMIAAGPAAEAAARVESAAEQGAVEEACSGCARLRQEIDRVLEALGKQSWKHAA